MEGGWLPFSGPIYEGPACGTGPLPEPGGAMLEPDTAGGGNILRIL